MGRRRRRGGDDDDNGFAEWGGYMNAKKAKLIDQYNTETSRKTGKLSNIFNGVAILVNGWTRPPAEELKNLMTDHGGVFHLYQMTGATTHIIASNLPNVKIKNLGNTPVVKPEWITESIKAGKLLDYKKFLLYTRQSRTQPRLDFIIKSKNKPIQDQTDNSDTNSSSKSNVRLLSNVEDTQKQDLTKTLTSVKEDHVLDITTTSTVDNAKEKCSSKSKNTKNNISIDKTNSEINNKSDENLLVENKKARNNQFTYSRRTRSQTKLDVTIKSNIRQKSNNENFGCLDADTIQIEDSDEEVLHCENTNNAKNKLKNMNVDNKFEDTFSNNAVIKRDLEKSMLDDTIKLEEGISSSGYSVRSTSPTSSKVLEESETQPVGEQCDSNKTTSNIISKSEEIKIINSINQKYEFMSEESDLSQSSKASQNKEGNNKIENSIKEDILAKEQCHLENKMIEDLKVSPSDNSRDLFEGSHIFSPNNNSKDIFEDSVDHSDSMILNKFKNSETNNNSQEICNKQLIEETSKSYAEVNVSKDGKENQEVNKSQTCDEDLFNESFSFLNSQFFKPLSMENNVDRLPDITTSINFEESKDKLKNMVTSPIKSMIIATSPKSSTIKTNNLNIISSNEDTNNMLDASTKFDQKNTNSEETKKVHLAKLQNTFDKATTLQTSNVKEDNLKSKTNDTLDSTRSSSVSVINKIPTKTASDPKFLSEFYNNSRLHLISTLGAEFKQLVCTMREKSNGKFPGKEKLLQTLGDTTNSQLPIIQGKVIMHIDMDCFFVSVGLRNRPDLKGKPVAVAHARGNPIRPSNPDRQAEFALYAQRLPEEALSRIDNLDNNSSMSELASCSYEARRCGIKNGMFLGVALKLCPNLQTIPYDFQGYREVSTMLYQTVASYTLDIEAVSCDEMYVDITDILQESGMSVYEWANHIRGEIMSKTGCPCSTGFGANRLQARLATRKAKPAGQYYLTPDEVEEYMCDVPLADLPGVGRATVYKLNNIGLKTCGDVQRTSLPRLQAELGSKAGETLLEQAKGVDKKPLNFEHERKSVSAEVNYGIRFKNKDEAMNFLQNLSEEVCTRLNDISMKAKSVTLKLMIRAADAPTETAKFLGHGVCDSLSRCTSANYLISDSKTVFKEVKALYEKLNLPPSELRGIGIQLGRLEKAPVVSVGISKFLKQAVTTKEKDTEIKENKASANVDKDEIDNIKATGVKEIRNKVDDNKKNLDSLQNKDDDIQQINVLVKPKINEINTKNDLDIQINSNSDLTKSKSSAIKENKNNMKRFIANDNTNKSRRGRPRGGGTRSKIVKNTTSLTNFFKSGKLDTSKNIQNTSCIDFDVLNELPADLREEILKNLEQQNKMLNTYCKKKENDKPGPSKEKEPASKPREVPSTATTKDVLEKEPIEKSAFSSLDNDQLKVMIRSWIKTEKPLEFDVKMLAEHFKELALKRKIEHLHVMVKFLHRLLEKENNCFWHDAYFTIVNYVQEGMLIQYGNTLMIPREFSCGIHS